MRLNKINSTLSPFGTMSRGLVVLDTLKLECEQLFVRAVEVQRIFACKAICNTYLNFSAIMDMIFGSMSAPDFFSHKSMREIQMDLGEVSEDSEGDDDYDFQSEDEDSFSSKHATKTPFSSRFKNQFIPVSLPLH